MLFRGIFLLALVFVSVAVKGQETAIHVVTEEAFPLQFTAENEIVGPTTDLVRAVLEQAELTHNIATMPWARAYEKAKHKPNTLIYSIARSEDREALFHWIGKVAQFEYFFYTTREFADQHVINKETIKQFRMGTVRNSVTFQHLTKNHFKYIFPVSHPDQNYGKLLNGRIDMFPASRNTFEITCANTRSDCSRFIPVLPLEMPVMNLYFAVSKSTSAEVIERIKSAYDIVVAQENDLLTSEQAN
jgi:polar amino acid transport system substrate-binding protein